MRIKRLYGVLGAIVFFARSFAVALIPQLSCEDLRRLQLSHRSNIIVVDVRPPADFANGHIQNAKNFSIEALRATSLSKDQQIVVYCGEDNCSLSTSAVSRLASLGYTNVSLLSGGFNEWLRHRYPVQNGAARSTPPAFQSVALDEARSRISRGNVFVIDVRPLLEFRAGHLPTARSIPLEGLDSAVTNLPKDREVLVYDRLSERSITAVKKAHAAGFKAFEISGGISAWTRKGYPLEVQK